MKLTNAQIGYLRSELVAMYRPDENVQMRALMELGLMQRTGDRVRDTERLAITAAGRQVRDSL